MEEAGGGKWIGSHAQVGSMPFVSASIVGTIMFLTAASSKEAKKRRKNQFPSFYQLLNGLTIILEFIDARMYFLSSKL